MVVSPQSEVDGQPAGNVLTEIDVTGNLVLGLVGHRGQVLTRRNHLVPGLAVDALPVETDCGGVALEKAEALPGRNACKRIFAAEPVCLGSCAFGVAVIDLVVAEVVVEADGAVRLVVVVLDGCRSHSAGDPLVGVEQRRVRGARI